MEPFFLFLGFAIIGYIFYAIGYSVSQNKADIEDFKNRIREENIKSGFGESIYPDPKKITTEKRMLLLEKARREEKEFDEMNKQSQSHISGSEELNMVRTRWENSKKRIAGWVAERNQNLLSAFEKEMENNKNIGAEVKKKALQDYKEDLEKQGQEIYNRVLYKVKK